MALDAADDWVSVFHSLQRLPCEEQALVLGAMKIEHRISERPDGCHVLVPAGLAQVATEQLRLYARENRTRHITPWPQAAPTRGLAGALLLALFLLLCWLLQSGYAFNIDWVTRGGFEAGRVFSGEWWRVATALTLHADVAHLAGNMLFGAFFAYLAGQYLGSGVTLLGIVVAASAGNVLNALVQLPDHRSIGASTAVFAALGLVGAFVWGLSRRYALGWARRWSPVVGAVALLTYVGTGDERTDIVAHLAGFLAGAGSGLLLHGYALSRQLSPRLQGPAGVLALLWMLGAWGFALYGAG